MIIEPGARSNFLSDPASLLGHRLKLSPESIAKI